jgi:uridine phosphorylase
VTPGPLIVVRFGTCGTLDSSLPVGSICLTTSSVCCKRNEDAWHEGSKEPGKPILLFLFSLPRAFSLKCFQLSDHQICCAW